MTARGNFIYVMRNMNNTNCPRNGYVGRDPDDRVYVKWTPVEGHTQYLTDMTTWDARLLAKRITQFLDSKG